MIFIILMISMTKNNNTFNSSIHSNNNSNFNSFDNNSSNSILVFEYYTASGINDPNIISEAITLIESLLNDLTIFSKKEFSNNDSLNEKYSNDENINIHFLVSDKFNDIGNSYDSINKNKIVIDIPLEEWLNENISFFDSCMFISAEKNMNLYNLTKIIEDNNVKIYGSDSESTLLSSNKFSTFKHLQNIVKQPKTFLFTITDENPWEISIKSIFEFLYDENNPNSDDYKLIVKPLYGVDCQDMVIISDLEDISGLKEKFPDDIKVIVQEFIPGENVSVSLISDGKQAIPISLNKQYININKETQEYLGGKLPYCHPLTKKAFSVAKKAVESIEGIKGFVGVDLIINDLNNSILNKTDSNNLNLNNIEKNGDNIYFLEINSRFTTPYVGLSKIANFNMGGTIIELLDHKIDIDYLYKKNIGFNQFDHVVKFKKNNTFLDIEIL
ncbi:Tyramine--L-glutamate ligase [Candidatus Methanobinarius endosymbioticus]|uniref:Tyramine--L-glutamate ligase n=1 Tax=Candidatus Methanobinarius endosymbioticus TaxID=2006182 RepID=A0A366MEG6_9EURY|nr:Tyramine--L-glutamate ligase [Candidatus Methanobinarius endosymbioticus]